MQQLNRKNRALTKMPPIKIVQFGEGNFLRAFVAYAFQKLNQDADFNAGIAVVQPIEKGMVSVLNEQDGLYTLFTKGIKEGKVVEEQELITTIVKGVDPYVHFEDYLSLAREGELEFIISNTTEAGIAYVASDTFEMTPPNSFPAKLTRLMFERFTYFKGDTDKGLTIIACELINYNSETLKKIILDYIALWKLSDDFNYWVLHACTFHNTLVDRIVPGYPKEDIADYNKQLDYKDNLIVSAEAFFLWVIEGDIQLKEKLPFHKTDLDVKIVSDMQPYRTRKVRILNGAHTAMVPFSLLYGNETVKETMDEIFTGPFIRSLVFDEIMPTLDMEKEALKAFAAAVFDRFKNPFIKHQLSSIALNSIAKFKVRVLPSLLDYVKRQHQLPLKLVFAFACLLRFYRGEWQGSALPLNDEDEIIAAFAGLWKLETLDELVATSLSNVDYWGEDLTQVKGLSAAVARALGCIEAYGIQNGWTTFCKMFK